MPLKNFVEKIRRLHRSFQRLMCGKSNEETIITGHSAAMVGVTFVPVTYTAIISKTGVENQLEFEKSQAVLLGPDRDVDRVRRLDAMIGKLMKPFNGAAGAPDKTISTIKRHAADVADSLQRIKAYKTEGNSKTPLECLEYGQGDRALVRIRLG